MVQVDLLPPNEKDRLDAVRRYDVLDTPPDGAFDRITALAARLFDVPISIVSIVDSDRIWFKSRHGLAAEETTRDPGLCASAILGDTPWLITDAKADPRALANPLVAGEFGLRFYAGVPLHTTDGFNLGTLCVIGMQPREVTAEEVATLSDLAAVVMDELELRLSARRTVDLQTELRQQAETVATTLQESLIPPQLPELAGIDLAARYHVAQRDRVGGDFYDVVPADWGAAVIVGDACGKGTMAAALAGTARWTLHTVANDEADPALALARLNAVLMRSHGGEQYVTAAVASIRALGLPDKGLDEGVDEGVEVTVAAGGHPLPLVVRRDGAVEQVGKGGPIIGWSAESRFSAGSTVLHRGDTLVMFTDGLLEAVAGHGEVDDAAVRALLAPLAGRPAADVADRVDVEIGADRRDDAAFVVARLL